MSSFKFNPCALLPSVGSYYTAETYAEHYFKLVPNPTYADYVMTCAAFHMETVHLDRFNELQLIKVITS